MKEEIDKSLTDLLKDMDVLLERNGKKILKRILSNNNLMTDNKTDNYTHASTMIKIIDFRRSILGNYTTMCAEEITRYSFLLGQIDKLFNDIYAVVRLDIFERASKNILDEPSA